MASKETSLSVPGSNLWAWTNLSLHCSQSLTCLRGDEVTGREVSVAPTKFTLGHSATLITILIIITVIIITRPKPPSGRQCLVGSWGKDTVRQVHYKMFSMSHFAPTALSSNWILLFKCGYKNSLVITKIFYFLLSTFYFLSEDKPLQTNKQTDRPFKKVIIFRYRQTHTSS